MNALTILALVLVVPVLLIPVVFVWYINFGGIVVALRKEKRVREHKIILDKA